MAVYDLETARRSLPRDIFQHRVHSLWRYRELLPILHDDSIITLGEGCTPVFPLKKLGAHIGIPHLRVKEEQYNPTGSFKARGLCLAVSRAVELGIRSMAMPSAGNAGGALAAYAAKARIEAHIFVPKDTPAANIAETSIFDANVHLIEGNISDASMAMNERGKGKGWFDCSTMKEPYRLEGKKTIGYEIAEQYSWKLPDVIVYPTGGGTGLIGMWKAFHEMTSLGWIEGDRLPRMISVQAQGCAPIVTAFEKGDAISEFWKDAHTIASGLRVPKAFADDLILKSLHESGGSAIAVSDREILADMKLTASMEGMLFCPEGAATVSAARRLLETGIIHPENSVLLFNTGSGYKYLEVLERLKS